MTFSSSNSCQKDKVTSLKVERLLVSFYFYRWPRGKRNESSRTTRVRSSGTSRVGSSGTTRLGSTRVGSSRTTGPAESGPPGPPELGPPGPPDLGPPEQAKLPSSFSTFACWSEIGTLHYPLEMLWRIRASSGALQWAQIKITSLNCGN